MSFFYGLLSSGMSLLWYLAAFAVMIGILVVIHEAGHFYAARLTRVRVLRFAVGFGPVLLAHKDRRDTEYTLCALPLGGYVAMQNTREEAEIPAETNERSYQEASLAARLFICSAGPIANLLLAIVLYIGLFSWGIPALRPVLGPIEPGTPAAEAGLAAGDEVLAADGSEIETLTDLRLAFLLGIPEVNLPMEVRRAETGLTEQLFINLSGLDSGKEDFLPLREAGIGSASEASLVIGAVLDDSPAQRAGLAVGDRLISVDGEPLDNWRQWVELVRSSPGELLQLIVQRDGNSSQVVELVPERVVPTEGSQPYGRVGVGQGFPRELLLIQRFGLWTATGKAVEKVGKMSLLTAKSIYRIVTGSLSPKTLSGPVGIARISGDAAQAGVRAFIYILALLSISLGCINLVPIPILDGGRIAIHLVEAALRRPLGEKVEMGLNALGLLLVSSLLVLTLIQDIARL